MKEVRFARYREYTDARVRANNSMVALLAGSRLAAHALQLNEGSPHQLPGLYPGVLDIDRFNLLPDAARELLSSADRDLAAVAIPYALAVYEAFVKDAIAVLDEAGKVVAQGGGSLNAGRMHTTFYTAAGTEEPVEAIRLFHVLRTMRNAQIHHGGKATDELMDQLNLLNGPGRERWERLSLAPASQIIDGDRIAFTLGHLIASFAVTKELARHVNATLQNVLTKEQWAAIALNDYLDETQEPKNSSNWRRGLLGFVRFHYSPVELAEHHMEYAARQANAWTATRWR